ncbi:MAG: nitrate reductase molybdenum cofactor assembly chaperone [Conexivisphaerales archaeon]
MNQTQRKTFYICSRLLVYPNSSLLSSLDELKKEAESLPEQLAVQLLDFIDHLADMDQIELQESYVKTFDFSENCSLYLSYPSLGVSMERGSELLKLKNLYRKSGMVDNGKELPDYLPTFLRFLSIAGDEDAELALRSYSTQITELANNVERVNSLYSKLFRVLVGAMGGEA